MASPHGEVSARSERRVLWRSRVWPILSLSLLIINALLFTVRPAAAALWTLFPVWVYTVPGFLLVAISGHSGRRGRRVRAALALMWMVGTLALADETSGMWRLLFPVRQRHSQAPDVLRVVSLNCSVGSPEAAAEVVAHRPDIVLLQETPSSESVSDLVQKLWADDGDYVWGMDGSVLARGAVESIELPVSIGVFATAARVKARGLTFVVVSFLLTTPPFRVEVWSPDAWRVQDSHRQAQCVQSQALSAFLQTLPGNMPIIIGGDCNAPGGDAALRVFEPRLRDAYFEGGIGWCNTFQNDFPVLRIDQIWLSRHWRVDRLVARRTQNSDHRMVICDLALKNVEK